MGYGDLQTYKSLKFRVFLYERNELNTNARNNIRYLKFIYINHTHNLNEWLIYWQPN